MTAQDPFSERRRGAWGPPPGSGYGPPPSPYGAQDTKTETKAILAIVLAVAAWTPTVPFVGALAALVLARLARRDILASGGRLTGLSLCTWAVVISWVHLVALALLAVLAVAIFLVPFLLSL